MTWFFETSIEKQSRIVNKVLTNLGIKANTERGKNIREVIAQEILGQEYDLMNKHSKATFIKLHEPQLQKLAEMVQNESLLTYQKKKGKKE